MSIEYINKQGATVTEAADKIKVVSQERRARQNVFTQLRAIPVQSESFVDGGGTYRFERLMGMLAATRRGGPDAGNSVTYGNNITLSPKVLTITEPLETPGGNPIPTSRSDVAQLDGMDFTPVAAAKTMNILVDGEIVEDTKALFETAGVRSIDNTTSGDYFEFYNTIHAASADYFDISEDNTNWTDTQAWLNFDAGRYQMEREDVVILVNPVDSANMAKELVEKGVTTGDMAYTDYKEGRVRMINGIGLVESRYVPKGKAGITPKGNIGAPDVDVIYTMIKTTEDAKGNLGTYGKHYYNSLLLFPELTTIVNFETAPVRASERKAQESAAKEAAKAAAKADMEAVKAELEAQKLEAEALKKELAAERKAKKDADKAEALKAEAEAKKAEAEAKAKAAQDAERLAKATSPTNLV